MRLCAGIVDPDRFGGLGLGGVKIATSKKSIREIGSRLQQARFQANGRAEFLNRLIVLTLRKENPAKGIVSLGALGCELHGTLESPTGARDIARLQQR
jgi:hypothetical protein